jgi:hypothetical protein
MPLAQGALPRGREIVKRCSQSGKVDSLNDRERQEAREEGLRYWGIMAGSSWQHGCTYLDGGIDEANTLA